MFCSLGFCAADVLEPNACENHRPKQSPHAKADQQRLGQLQTELDLEETLDLCMVDQWLGIDVRMIADQPTSWWAFPIETVSNSEGGFELVHQSISVHPHWFVRGDAHGRWSVTIQLELDTSLARSRMNSSIG